MLTRGDIGWLLSIVAAIGFWFWVMHSILGMRVSGGFL